MATGFRDTRVQRQPVRAATVTPSWADPCAAGQQIRLRSRSKAAASGLRAVVNKKRRARKIFAAAATAIERRIERPEALWHWPVCPAKPKRRHRRATTALLIALKGATPGLRAVAGG